MDDPVRRVEAWVRRFVVGQGLCPFAAAPLDAGRVIFERIGGADPLAVATEIGLAARRLLARPADEVETVLLVCPEPWLDFEALLAVADLASAHLDDTGLSAAVQVVAFHPEHRFEGAAADDPANATNRAPVPTFQLLRQESVARAVADPAEAERIWRRNVAHLRRLGAEAVARLLERDDVNPQAAATQPARRTEPSPGDPAAS